jgi:anti-sigma-K factor RskA
MATSGSATVQIGLNRLKKVEKLFYVDLNALGNTATAFAITLDTTFNNEPVKVAVPPISHAGGSTAYAVTYDSSTPKLSLAVTGDTDHASSTVPVIVIAYDQP